MFSVVQTLTINAYGLSFPQPALAASNGALIEVGNLDLASPNTLAVDASSAIEIGAAAQGAPPARGAITIDPGATLSVGYSGPSQTAIFGTLIDNGTLSIPLAQRSLFNIDQIFASIGTLWGSGVFDAGGYETIGTILPGSLDAKLLGQNYATLDVTGTVGAGNVFDLSAGGELDITAAPSGLYDTMAGTITGFGSTASLGLSGRTVTSVLYTPASDAGGTLSFLSGYNMVGSVTMGGTFSGETFIVGNRFGDNNTVTLTPGTFSTDQGILSIVTAPGATSSLGDIESQSSSKPTEVDAAGAGTLAIDTVQVLSRLVIGAGTTVAVDPNFVATITTTQIDAGGTLENSGSNPYAQASNLTGDGTILTGGAHPMSFDGSVASGLTVAVAQGGGGFGELDLGLPQQFDATIAGFAAGDSLSFSSNGGPVTATQSGDASLTTVTLTQDGGTLASLRFAGDFTDIVFSTDDVTLTATEIACFCRGTRIRTPEGDVPVETLRIGQAVTTLSGTARPIKWIGTRRYAAPFAHANEDVHPIRIDRDALSDGVPSRDLFVSPLHALYLDHVLVPARLLMNGRTITQIHDRALIEYFHIELDRHDILLAEDTAAESFVDCDSRQMFANARDFEQLYPGDDGPRWAFCAPRVEDGARLARITLRLEQRAAARHGDPATEPGPAALHGHLDFLDREQVSGWAWDASRPNRAVTLEIANEEGVLGRITANRMRSDVRKAGFGTGRYGFVFRFPVPLAGVSMQRIHVRAAPDDAANSDAANSGAANSGAAISGSPGIVPATSLLTPEMYPALGEALLAGAAQAGTSAEIDATIGFLLASVADLRERRDRLAARPGGSGTARPLAIVVDDHAPDPTRTAGGQAILSHMRSLARLGCDVLFVPMDMQSGLAEESGVRECAAPHYRSVEEALRRHGAEAALVYLHRISNADRFAALARHACPRARLVFAVADLHFLRLAREARVTGELAVAREAEAMFRLESAMAARVDTVLTHSTHEAALLARRVPQARVQVVPWQIDLAPAPPIAASGRAGVAFIGGWSHGPNRDAIRTLLESILPRLNRMRPMIPCLLIGAGLPAALRGALPPGASRSWAMCATLPHACGGYG